MGPRVFGIGLSKTGTTSLSCALEILGYTAIHYPALSSLDQLLEHYEAATDTSIACRFEELDLRYPNSRYILTIRDPTSWLKSAEREFKGRDVQEHWKQDVRKSVYGTVTWEPVVFLRSYHEHNARALNYFRLRPDSFLVMNIVAGEGWEPLCRFLGVPIPSHDFPHENVTNYDDLSVQ